jgi:hypothetical protein
MVSIGCRLERVHDSTAAPGNPAEPFPRLTITELVLPSHVIAKSIWLRSKLDDGVNAMAEMVVKEGNGVPIPQLEQQF